MENFEFVTKVETKDGTLFDSKSEAENYIINDICEEVNEIIKNIEFYDLKHRDLIKLIDGLCGGVDKIERLKKILDKHLY